MRKPCLICREIQYYLAGDDLQSCRSCGSGTFGPGTPALKLFRGFELSEKDVEILRVNRIKED